TVSRCLISSPKLLSYCVSLALAGRRAGLQPAPANLEFKAPGQKMRLSLSLTGLWTYVQHIGEQYIASVLVEVQAARKLVVMHSFILAV
ncbi:MAG TPA: hypothetical protein PKX36_08510, partial [Candidatus Cloacimonadota bacterium]|nr:hypothetical protein [Candidatus Cloacimonadota bacterium]